MKEEQLSIEDLLKEIDKPFNDNLWILGLVTLATIMSQREKSEINIYIGSEQ